MVAFLLIIALLLAPGSSFAWTITSGFETGNDGQRATNSIVGSDAFLHSGTLTTITTDAYHSGAKACEIAWPAPVNNTLDTANSYKWILSGGGTTEYYLLNSDNSVPTTIHLAAEQQVQRASAGGVSLTYNWQHAVGSLAAGEWNLGNNDSLSGVTLYVRLSDGTDPDSKGAGHMVHSLYDSGYNSDVGMTCGGSHDPTSNVLVDGELWSRAYYYFKSSWVWSTVTGPAIKTMRFAKRASGDVNKGCLSIYTCSNTALVCSQNWPCAGSGISGTVGAPALDLEQVDKTGCDNGPACAFQEIPRLTFGPDQWYCVEMYTKFTDDDTSILRMWIDGVLKAEKTGVQIAYDAGSYIYTLYFMAYWNCGVPQAQIEYMDDISITTDTPSNQDAVGNYMIGPTDWSGSSGTPGPQMGYGGTVSGGAIH